MFASSGLAEFAHRPRNDSNTYISESDEIHVQGVGASVSDPRPDERDDFDIDREVEDEGDEILDYNNMDRFNN